MTVERFDPAFLSIAEEELEESAARQLENCPALLALITLRMEGLGQRYDTAADMEKVKEIRGGRNALRSLLNLRWDVEERRARKNP